MPPDKTAPQHPVLFYDGTCALCHAAVRFVLRHDDRQQFFLFAPLGGKLFSEKAAAFVGHPVPDSILVLTEEGVLLARSEAVIRILRDLGGGWRFLGGLLNLVPRGIADAMYDLVAKWRHRFAAKPPSICPIVPEEKRNHFRD